MMQRQVAHHGNKLEKLQERIGKRVGNVSFQAREDGFVIESAKLALSLLPCKPLREEEQT